MYMHTPTVRQIHRPSWRGGVDCDGGHRDVAGCGLEACACGGRGRGWIDEDAEYDEEQLERGDGREYGKGTSVTLRSTFRGVASLVQG
jgi:hypothetical protein